MGEVRTKPEQLEEVQDCRVIPSFTYEDGYKIFRSRSDFGCIVVDWDIPDEDPAEATTAKELIVKIRKRHQGIPIGPTHGAYGNGPDSHGNPEIHQ